MTDRSTTSAILRISAAGACVGAIYSALAHSEAGTGLVVGAGQRGGEPVAELILLRQWAAPARALHRPALASVALMERLAAPPAGVELIAIAPPPLRGKSAPLELVALAMEDS